MSPMKNINELFAAFSLSRFRSRFRLAGKEAEYLKQKGLAEALDHARGFINARLADAQPTNDGKQTPMKNHPAFITQHATATCCRKCLEKWHNIPQGMPLTEQQIDYIVSVLKQWLTTQKT